MFDVIATYAADVAPRAKPSNYPPAFAARMAGRIKRQLGDVFALANFGVNLTSLEPGAVSALHHVHSRQDEFIYILEGTATLIVGDTEATLQPGMCAGFKAGGQPHHLENRSASPILYIEIGDRTEGDEVVYPADDLMAVRTEGTWEFRHKDGTGY